MMDYRNNTSCSQQRRLVMRTNNMNTNPSGCISCNRKQQEQQQPQVWLPNGFRSLGMIWASLALGILVTTYGQLVLSNSKPKFAMPFEPSQFDPAVPFGSDFYKQQSQQQQQQLYHPQDRLIHHPRILQIDFSNRGRIVPSTTTASQQEALRERPHREISLEGLGFRRKKNNNNNSNNNGLPVDSREECQSMEWQSERFLSCNNIHEMNLERLSFINCGGSRCAFEFVDSNGKSQVLKVLKYSAAYTEWTYETARRDALAMERLTSSPYVASIYDYCGTSQIVEHSAHGNLFDWMKLTRHHVRQVPTPLEKLKFAIQISTGIADMHSLDSDKGLVSMTHNDVCCHQFMLVDGVFKLGDFHLSTFVKRNATSDEACQEKNANMNSVLDKVRAPEELGPTRIITPLDKVDVFLMGNVMYYILTQRWIFEGIKATKAIKRLIKGKRPNFGFEPTDPADKAVAHAITWSWTHDPQERPSAKQVSDYLTHALDEIEGKNRIIDDTISGSNHQKHQHHMDIDRIRVSVPPLPSDYDFSDLEFYHNLGHSLSGKAV